MSMSRIAGLIGGSEKLISLIGAWPSCHDAEVIELYFERGGFTHAAQKEWDLPTVTAKLILFEGSAARKPDGTVQYLELTIAALRFEGVEDVVMNGFNWQNPIMSLEINDISTSERKFGVEFVSVAKPGDSFSMGLKFSCESIRVLDAVKWPFEKRTPIWFSPEQLRIFKI